jgi:hypothetical protein
MKICFCRLAVWGCLAILGIAPVFAARAAEGWSTPVGGSDALAAAQRLFGKGANDSSTPFCAEQIFEKSR